MTGSVLLVAPDPHRLSRYAQALRTIGCIVRTAASFQDAKAAIATAPVDVLVTELRLGEFNGLHLALVGRGCHAQLRTLVIGYTDPVIEADARALCTFYVTSADEQDVLSATREALEQENPRRRWTRHRLPEELGVEVDGRAARIFEVSFGGVGLHMDATFTSRASRSFMITIPSLGLQADATCVWMRSLPDRPGEYRCGAALSEAHARPGSAWRAIVDTLAPASGSPGGGISRAFTVR